MNVSLNNINVPLIAPTVNLPTEQVARDNRVKQPVRPTVAMSRAQAERKTSTQEKHDKNQAWDPSLHPDYEVDAVSDQGDSEDLPSPLTRWFELLALSSYSKNQGLGYTVRFRLPKNLLDGIAYTGEMNKRRQVIRYHYGHSVAPNSPSHVIAVL